MRITLLFVVCTLMVSLSPAPTSAQSRTQIVILGTGTPIPDPDRSGPGVAIVVDSVAYLFDAGRESFVELLQRDETESRHSRRGHQTVSRLPASTGSFSHTFIPTTHSVSPT
jgi:Metal-dependent hydrolases of the beta-lactamase superfamily III